MVERRTMGKAMEMTPAMKAFISGDVEKTDAVAREIELKSNAAAVELAETVPRPESTPRAARRSARRMSSEAPGVSEILDQLLVPITIRVQHRTAHALRRAHLEQRLNHAKPDTQQEIVEDALSDWLNKRGYLG